MKMIIHKELRLRLKPLTRYIATPETAHRCFFSFVDAAVMPDNTFVVVPSMTPPCWGYCPARFIKHGHWHPVAAKVLEATPVYVKSRCFDTFPFPDTTDEQKNRIRDIAEQLDAHRKVRQAASPQLTLTALYGVLKKSRSGVPLSAKDLKITDEAGLQELQRLHDELDFFSPAAFAAKQRQILACAACLMVSGIDRLPQLVIHIIL